LLEFNLDYFLVNILSLLFIGMHLEQQFGFGKLRRRRRRRQRGCGNNDDTDTACCGDIDMVLNQPRRHRHVAMAATTSTRGDVGDIAMVIIL